PDVEPHNTGTLSEAKQHSNDGTPLVGAEEARTLVFSGSQGAEVVTHTPAGIQSQPSSGGPDERLAAAQLLAKTAVAEGTPTPAVEVLSPVAQELSDVLVPDADLATPSPRHHGLLLESLALDFASLRSEVESFFAQIDDLGGYAAERRITMILSSGAVVVAAAMACEVARRQARRPA